MVIKSMKKILLLHSVALESFSDATTVWEESEGKLLGSKIWFPADTLSFALRYKPDGLSVGKLFCNQFLTSPI